MGGKVIREHVGALMNTEIESQMFSVFAGDEHLVAGFTGQARSIAWDREDTARETIAEVNPDCFLHPALRSENLAGFSHDASFCCANCWRNLSSFCLRQSFVPLRLW
jgi:hypothetical protein